nr:LPD1 domain-containing protein [uncultured Acinetobacter sp.]
MSVNDKNPFENLPVSTDPVGTVNTLIKVLRKQQSDEPKAKFSGTYENAFTLKVDEKERISKAVDQLATSLQSYPQPIQMNMPPAMIALNSKHKNLNIQDLPLELDRQTLRKITGQVDGKKDVAHQFTLDQVKQLFSEIADPLLILETDAKNGVIILTSMKDQDDSPVIAAIHLNKKKGKYEFNDIASMYGKNSFEHWLSKREDKIIYLNKKKSLESSTLPPHQLQGVVDNEAYAQNILSPDDIVNFFKQESDKAQVFDSISLLLDSVHTAFQNVDITPENVLSIIDSIIALLTPDDGLSDVTTAENYRWKDTAIIAGARKFLSQTFTEAKKQGRNIVISDIDWDEMAKDGRLAQSLINKQNVFGVVDWSNLRDDGMPSNVAYLIKRVFDAVDKGPVVPLLIESQKNYVTAVSTLRQRLEKVRTFEELRDELIALGRQIVNPKYLEAYYADAKFAERVKALQLYETRVMSELGRRFYSWLFKTGNKALHECRTGKNPTSWQPSKGNDWSWLESEPKTKDDAGKETKPKKQSFQLESAADIERVGGPEVKINSSKELEQKFGFRGIQSGNWVLKDKSSAEFHMQATAEAMTDMSDVLGIDPKHLGLNGNLALAFGARGKKGALAHYEPSSKVINITKMKGGGSLGHEYFHALDNLIQDLSTQTVGEVGFFGTRDFSKISDPDLAAAFKNLNESLKTRKNRLVYSNKYINLQEPTEDSNEELISKAKSFARDIGLDPQAPFELSLVEVGQKFVAWFNEKRRRTNAYIDSYASRMMGEYLITRHFAKGDVRVINNSVYMDINGFDSPSDFYVKALSLDEGKVGKYWSKELEMAARAFSAYLQDRLADQGRKNDYLAYSTQGGNNRIGEIAYPQDVERTQVNAAFDELFKVIREKKVLETASENKSLMDSIFGDPDPIDEVNPINESAYIEFGPDVVHIYDASNNSGIETPTDLLISRFKAANWKPQAENNFDFSYDFFIENEAKFNIKPLLWSVEVSVNLEDGSTQSLTWNSIDIGVAITWINQFIKADSNKLKSVDYDNQFSIDDAKLAALSARRNPGISSEQLLELAKDYQPTLNDYLAQSAATSDLNQGVDPSQEQLINNDYTTGKFKINELEIQIENPAGSTRSGTGANGTTWNTEMTAHYGFISDTLGKDGDEIDVFVAAGTPHDYAGPYFVVYQNDETGKFDEHKTVIGVPNRGAAIKLYQDHYDENWSGLGAVIEFTTTEAFKQFLEAETAVNRSNSPVTV